MKRTTRVDFVLALPAAWVAALAIACSQERSPAPAAPSSAAAPAVSAGTPWFEDVAAASGLDFRHVRALEQRFLFPEIMGAGLAWLDYDGDGWMDLYAVQSGDLQAGDREMPGNLLFRNLGNGRFADVTAKAGVGDRGYGMGCTVGDYDGDGHVDLYVTNVGPSVLYKNRGDGTFQDVTASAGVAGGGWSTSAGFFDYDADDDLDLWVVDYLRWSPEREIDCKSNYGERDYCSPNNYSAPAQCRLYRNEGDGTFRDASQAAGIGAAFGNGLGLALADFDRDGRLDAYVANDGMPNQLWINQGDGRFVDKSLLSGAAVNRNGAAEACMGVALGDVDGNGFLDVFLTNLRGETNRLYLNQGGVMVDRTPQSGLTLASLQFTGFGDGLFDFDHDGRLDLYVCNGRVGQWKPAFSTTDVYAEPAQLFRGLERARFEEVMPQGGTASAWVGNARGAAFADYDNDGDVDVAVSTNHGPLRLLRNIAPPRGRWMLVRALDARGVDTPGAHLMLQAGGQSWHRDVVVCSSYCSANDPRMHFGLPAGTPAADLRVTWPGGEHEFFGPLEPDRAHVVRRGAGRATR